MKSDQITFETLLAARDGERDAVDAVAAEMMRIAGILASSYARGSVQVGVDHSADYESAALESMWEAVRGLTGDTVIRTTATKFLVGAAKNGRNSIRAEVGKQTAPGAERHAMATFLSMLKLADGDVYAAEKMAQTVPSVRDRLSAENAHATRRAYQGTVSFDAYRLSGISDGVWLVTSAAFRDVRSVFDVPEDLLTSEDLNSIDRQRRIEAVREALTHLSELRQNVLKARCGFPEYADDMSNADVAELLGITPKSCKEAWSNGLSQMRKLLDYDSLYGANKPTYDVAA